MRAALGALARRAAAVLRVTPARVYNLSVSGGVLLVAVGAGRQFGEPVGLMVAGGLVLAFTLYGVERLMRSRG